jgi:caffeoyl-CoA O-methyltransferase
VTERPKSFHLSPDVHAYLVQHGTPPDAVQRELIEETRKLGGVSLMQIAPEQGAFMAVLTRLLGARRAIEVGTFTGYSALCIARVLSDGGRLITCDVSEQWSAMARRYWEKAGVANRIELRLGPAIQTLRSLPDEESFDLGFIDADKPGYADYYEEILKRLRPGGVILADNVLWAGNVLDPTVTDPNTEAIRRFNDKLAADERIDRVMLPIADGLTLARKR